MTIIWHEYPDELFAKNNTDISLENFEFINAQKAVIQFINILENVRGDSFFRN